MPASLAEIQAGRALEARVKRVESRGRALEQELHAERRRVFVDAIRTGRWPAEKRDALERTFDADPAAVASMVAGLPCGSAARAGVGADTRGGARLRR